MTKLFARFPTSRFLANGLVAVLLLTFYPHAVTAAAPLVATGENRSFNDLLAKAAAGDVAAQQVVAESYLEGKGVPQNIPEGIKWLRRLADQQDPRAQYVLGTLHDEGKGVPRDLREAVKWYQKAADQNLADAQYNLAMCYAQGDGVPKDVKKAAEWMLRAANQEDAEAQRAIGLAYIDGNGVEKNPAEAARWLTKAAYQNVPVAQFFLGRLYADGNGVLREPETAARWFYRAATNGFAQAQYYYGNALLTGTGVARNAAEGWVWMEKAAKQGDKDAMAVLHPGTRASTATTTANTPPPLDRTLVAAAANTRPMATSNAASAFTPTPAPAMREPAVPPAAATPTNAADLAGLPFTPPPANTNLTTPSTMRDTLPALPALPSVEATTEKTGGTKTPDAPKPAGLPPFGETNATKSGTAGATRGMFDLTPTHAKETDSMPTFTEPPPSKEPHEPAARLPRGASAAGCDGGDMKWIAIVSAVISAAILFLGVFMLYTFQTRLRSLETELKKAQFELSKANVNLSAMMHQVKQLSLAAPPAPAPKTSLPEWNPEPPKEHARSFKMNRGK